MIMEILHQSYKLTLQVKISFPTAWFISLVIKNVTDICGKFIYTFTSSIGEFSIETILIIQISLKSTFYCYFFQCLNFRIRKPRRFAIFMFIFLYKPCHSREFEFLSNLNFIVISFYLKISGQDKPENLYFAPYLTKINQIDNRIKVITRLKFIHLGSFKEIEQPICYHLEYQKISFNMFIQGKVIS